MDKHTLNNNRKAKADNRKKQKLIIGKQGNCIQNK